MAEEGSYQLDVHVFCLTKSYRHFCCLFAGYPISILLRAVKTYV